VGHDGWYENAVPYGGNALPPWHTTFDVYFDKFRNSRINLQNDFKNIKKFS
jgi:hypothetical protein